jgi:hypothetical protein
MFYFPNEMESPSTQLHFHFLQEIVLQTDYPPQMY